MYLFCLTMSQNLLKNSFGIWKSDFQILAKIEMMQYKNQLFSRHFETVQHFISELCFLIVHTYRVQIW